MNRVIIGSSNVYRYYNKVSYPNFNDYLLTKCTDIKIFEAIMTNLGKNDSEVIVSVMENFIDKAGSPSTEQTEDEYAELVGDMIDVYMRIIDEAAVKNPGTKFAIVDPIWRPKLDWYQDMYDDLISTCKESLAKLKRVNISRIETMPEGCQQFEEDKVHLTKDSAAIFIEAILKNSENFFRAPFVDLGEDAGTKDVKLETRVDKLENHVRARQANDNLCFARLREESDTMANKAKEDRVVITGITSKSAPPTDPEQQKTWIKKIASDIFELLIPDFQGQIHFVNQARNKGTHIPLIEVKLDSVENATKIRKAFAEKKKANVDLGRIFVSNSVGLSTRVRVDVLKAIARKITDSSIIAHVVAFISRPVMHVKSTEWSDVKIVPKTFTYVDAVAEFGHRMSQFELGDAYRRAGTAFKGQMEQMFVIMRERDHQEQHHQQHQQQHQQRGAGNPNNGRKRQREDDDDQQGSSWHSDNRNDYSRGRGGGRSSGRGRGKGSYRGRF